MNLKKVIVSLGIFSSVALNAADSNSIKHYGYSALFGFGAETIVHNQYTHLDDFDKIALGTAIGTIPGLFKELTDDHFSTSDMAFDIAGALSGAVFSNYLNNNTSIFVSHDKKKDATKIHLAYNF